MVSDAVSSCALFEFVELANLPEFMGSFARHMGFTEREVD